MARDDKAEVTHRHTTSDIRGGRFPEAMLPSTIIPSIEAAQATAASKSKVAFSDLAASGTDFSNGDTWYQRIAGIIIAQWEFTGGAWAARTLDGAVVANLDASKITTGTLAAGQKITAGDPEGSRVELDSAGLRKYAADGVSVQVDLTGEVAAFSGLITGSEIIGGEFKTAASGARVEIMPVETGGEVRFHTGLTGETAPGYLRGDSGGIDSWLTLEAPAVTDQGRGVIRVQTGAEGAVILTADNVGINQGVDDNYTHIGGQVLYTNISTLEKTWFPQRLMRRIMVVADATQRDALVTAYTGAPRFLVIDSTHPLFVWQADAAAGSQLLSTTDGTTWTVIGGGGGTPASVPIGTILEFVGATAPSGFVMCDGAAYSRTTLSDLFGVIGTTFGAGDGTTTFNVPNRKGRVGVGRDAAQTEFDVLGETGGAKTHTLATTEMPSHTHPVIYEVGNTGKSGFVWSGGPSGGVFGFNPSVTNVSTGLYPFSAGPTGGGGAHNNLQPYIAMNYIIKTHAVPDSGSGGPLFADPGADRIAFWDDAAGAFAPLTASTGLTLTGTDLTVRAASDTQTGIVELATTAEAVTGTDPYRVVTPAGVKAATNALATIGAWTAYTPTLSAMSGSFVLGTGGINACVWRYEGALVRVRFQFRLGTGFTFPTGDPCFALPVAAEALAHSYMVYNGYGSALNAAQNQQHLLNMLAAGASTTVAMLSAGANPTGSTPITPTSPWTWTAGADIAGEFTYRPA